MKRIKKIFIGTTISAVTIYLILIIVAYLPYETKPVTELAGTEDRFIQVSGRAIHYIKQGNGNPLILVHGFAGSTYTWRHLIPLLADRYTVYALDLLGFGLSDKPPEGKYDMASHANVVVSFMDALKLTSATLIGHSMGGVVVSYVSIAAPSKVDSLILIEPGFYAKGSPAFMKYLFFPLDRIMARQFYSRGFIKMFLTNSYYKKALVTDEVIDAYMVPTRTPGALDAMAHMMKSVGSKRYEGITVKISRPTLIVWGENPLRKDMVVKLGEAQQFNREIEGSKLIFIKECGHYIQEEKPEELAQVIGDFLTETESKTGF